MPATSGERAAIVAANPATIPERARFCGQSASYSDVHVSTTTSAAASGTPAASAFQIWPPP